MATSSPSSSPSAPDAPAQLFPPFPLRPRSNMEIFDASIKLYKQYFWVLLGWSAVVSGIGLIAATSCGGFASLFLSPMFIGAICCCIAAAVRGQAVTFNQCWKFTQPRYGPILGMYLLSSLIGGLACAVVVGICTAAFVAGAIALAGAATAVQVTMTILGIVVLGTLATVVCTVFVTWITLVPIVVCLEEDKRNTQALGRAYDLLRGRWMSITALMAVVGLSMIALFLVLAGFAALIIGIPNIIDAFQGKEPSPGAVLTALFAFLTSYTFLLILITPLYDLIIAVYYLDLRVRKEALDLEWAAHTTAPTPTAPVIGTTIAPNENWQAPGAFTPEYSSATVETIAPTAPTSPVPQSDTINYSPHATQQLHLSDENDENVAPEYSSAQTAGFEAGPDLAEPDLSTPQTIASPPTESPFSFASETTSEPGIAESRINEVRSDNTPAETDAFKSTPLPFSDLGDVKPDAPQSNEQNRW